MIRKCILAAGIASTLLVFGCASTNTQTTEVSVQAPSPAEQLVGQWMYDPEHLEEMILEELEKAGLDVSLISEENYEEMLRTANEAVEFGFDFSEDGTVVGYHRVEDDTEAFEANWTIDGAVVTMQSTGDDESVTGRLVNGKLEIGLPVAVDGLEFIRLIKVDG